MELILKLTEKETEAALLEWVGHEFPGRFNTVAIHRYSGSAFSFEEPETKVEE